MKPRIGIYSGTFDPVHRGHLAFAQEASRICKLDRVVFLPEHTPRGKQQVTQLSHRLALLELAIKTTPKLQVVQLHTPQFTVAETLPELQAKFGDAELTLLIGSDVARTFSYRWDGLDQLLREVALCIGLRTGDDADEMQTLLAKVAQDCGVAARYDCVRTASHDVTSSQIRDGTADPSHLHPSALEYIQAQGLYR